jgi:hypothetical protein
MHAAVGRNEDMYAAAAPTNSHEAQNSQLVEVALAVQPCNHEHDDIKAKVDEFRDLVVRPLPTMILCTPAPLCHAKIPTTEDGLPCHSRRVAAQSKHQVSNLEVQAQNVLMHKLGITSVNRSPTRTRSRPTMRSSAPPRVSVA